MWPALWPEKPRSVGTEMMPILALSVFGSSTCFWGRLGLSPKTRTSIGWPRAAACGSMPSGTGGLALAS
jgi:hypothetical protein